MKKIIVIFSVILLGLMSISSNSFAYDYAYVVGSISNCEGTLAGDTEQTSIDCDTNPQLNPGSKLIVTATCYTYAETSITYTETSITTVNYSNVNYVFDSSIFPDKENSSSSGVSSFSYRLTVPKGRIYGEVTIGLVCTDDTVSDTEYSCRDADGYCSKAEDTFVFSVETIGMPSDPVSDSSESDEDVDIGEDGGIEDDSIDEDANASDDTDPTEDTDDPTSEKTVEDPNEDETGASALEPNLDDSDKATEGGGCSLMTTTGAPHSALSLFFIYVLFSLFLRFVVLDRV